MNLEYLSLLVIFLFSLVLVVVILGLAYFVSAKVADPEKVSPYECGFNPFEDARQKFDVRFYLVGILFIIFDLEVTFLFPWALTLSYIGYCGFYAMMIFLAILTLGFIYEWRYGALDWE